jgi:hypothetical protein
MGVAVLVGKRVTLQQAKTWGNQETDSGCKSAEGWNGQ